MLYIKIIIFITFLISFDCCSKNIIHDATTYNKFWIEDHKVDNVLNKIKIKINHPNSEIKISGLRDYVESLNKRIAFENMDVIIPLHKDLDSDVRRYWFTAIGRLFLYNEIQGSSSVFIERYYNFKRVEEKYFINVKKIIPMLLYGLHSDDIVIIVNTELSIARIGSFASECLPALMENLKHPDEKVQQNAIIAIGNMGKEGLKYIKQIESFQKRVDNKELLIEVNRAIENLRK